MNSRKLLLAGLLIVLVIFIGMFFLFDTTLDTQEILKLKEEKASIENSDLYKADFKKILLNKDLTLEEQIIKALIKLETGKEYGVFTTKQKSEGEVLKEYMEKQESLKFRVQWLDKRIELSGGENGEN